MAIPESQSEREHGKFKESTATVGQVAVVVTNPDGTNIASGTGGAPVTQAAVTNRSGTITAGGTAQQLAAVLVTRRYLFIQNIDPGEDLWFNFTTTAVVGQPSIKLSPGAAFVMEGSFVSTELVSVIAATTGHAFVAKEG